MTDFLGRELNIGDKVVALARKRTSSTLYLGEIENLTSKMVTIKTVGSKHDWRYGEIMHVSLQGCQSRYRRCTSRKVQRLQTPIHKSLPHP